MTFGTGPPSPTPHSSVLAVGSRRGAIVRAEAKLRAKRRTYVHLVAKYVVIVAVVIVIKHTAKIWDPVYARQVCGLYCRVVMTPMGMRVTFVVEHAWELVTIPS